MTTLRRVLAGAALATLALTAAACSNGGQEGSDSLASSAAPGTVAREGAAAIVGGDTASDGGGAAVPEGPGANRTVVTVRSVIKTGEVAVTNDDLDNARAELDGLLLGLEGSVDSEATQNDSKGRIEQSTLVVRVPVEQFDTAMTAIEGLGTAKHSDARLKDVTTEVIDVNERVETLENSLDRLQSYQQDAQDIRDLLRYEQQITDREAELQSLKSQQSYLLDQTSMSFFFVDLSTPEKYVPPPGALDDAGFLSGLKSGWNALMGTVVVVLTVVGAMLPFAAVLALVGVPLWLLVRRSVRGRGTGAPTPSDVPAE